MKKIIKGKTYNTDTSQIITGSYIGCYDIRINLYVTRRKDYFLWIFENDTYTLWTRDSNSSIVPIPNSLAEDIIYAESLAKEQGENPLYCECPNLLFHKLLLATIK